MATFEIKVNGIPRQVEAEPDMPLLWALRDRLGLVGAKFGCGIGQCGACTVHLGGAPVRSCTVRISDVGTSEVRTLEGLADGGDLHPLQQAWIDYDVAQCGYCQSGQIMQAAALLAREDNPTDAAIDQAMAGNYCRCGTYLRIRKAVKAAARDARTALFHDASQPTPRNARSAAEVTS